MAEDNKYGKFTINGLVYHPEYKTVGKLIRIDQSEFMPKLVVEHTYGLNKDIEKYNYGALEPMQDLKAVVKMLIKDLLEIDVPNYDVEIAHNHEILAKKFDEKAIESYNHKLLYYKRYPGDFMNDKKQGRLPIKPEELKTDNIYKEIGIRLAINDYFNFNNLAAWRMILNINKNLSLISLDDKKNLITELNLKTNEIEKLKLFSIPKTFCLAALEHSKTVKEKIVIELDNKNQNKQITKASDDQERE